MTLEEAKGYVLRRAKEMGLEAELLFVENRELSISCLLYTSPSPRDS